ncbi:ABC transporter permease [Georgenia sunbinii]|uniref:ABC transporter permease n=1 Tax=Georgenia sunbinii TaxID=3117728 RepID=UPI002F269240
MSNDQQPDQRRTGTMRAIGLVARREVKVRFLAKSNLISLAIMLVVLVAGVFVLDYFVSRDEADTGADYTVAVDAGVADLEPHLTAAAAAMGTSIDLETMDRAAAETALEDDLDGFLAGSADRPELLVQSTPDEQLVALVTTATQEHVLTVQVTELGGDPAEVQQALAQAVPQVSSLAVDEDDDQFGPQYLIAIVAISLLLFALIGTGSLIAMGVVEEKSSRVVEILLATIRPSELLAGKILGIGVVGLAQVLLLGGGTFAAMAATGVMSGVEVDLGLALLMLIVWFLLGFAVYSLLFGGFAALISRQEEIGAVTTPLMFLMFVPFYLSMFLITSNPDGTAVKVLSQVPFFAPFMMPMRSVYGAVAAWEIGLAVVIALAIIPLLVWIAGRIYKRGVLHTGGRMKLTEALRG